MIPVRSQWGRYNLPRHILYMFMMVLSPWNDWYDNPPRTGPLPVSFLDLLRQAFEELVTCDIWVPCWVLLGWYPDIYGKSMENLLQIHLKWTIGPQWLAAGWRSRHPSAWAWRKRARLQECTRNTPGTAEWCLGLWNWDHDPMTQSPLQICDCQA